MEKGSRDENKKDYWQVWPFPGYFGFALSYRGDNNFQEEKRLLGKSQGASAILVKK